jgi:D-alanyl-lipoteichoic acid acyltransferase DltB (MBOAT superfamily)
VRFFVTVVNIGFLIIGTVSTVFTVLLVSLSMYKGSTGVDVFRRIGLPFGLCILRFSKLRQAPAAAEKPADEGGEE